MADLGHRERPEEFAALGGYEPLGVLVRVAEVEDRTAEEAELDAGLDLQARRGGDRLLESGDRAGVLIGPAQGLRQCGERKFGGGHETDGCERVRPRRLEVVGGIEVGGLVEGELASQVSGVGPGTVEDRLDGCGVEVEGEVGHVGAPDLLSADESMVGEE